MVQLRILEILEEQGHTKYWLYKRMDMLSYQNFKNIVENKTSAIRFETLNKLQRILEAPIGDLFQLTEDETEEWTQKMPCQHIPVFSFHSFPIAASTPILPMALFSASDLDRMPIYMEGKLYP